MSVEDQADPIANFDQVLRGLADLAKLIRVYYEGLCEQGFTESQALALTIAYQRGFQGGSDAA